MNKKDLWLRLKAYHFDHLVPSRLWHRVAETFGGEDASTKAFAGKIARKLDWPNRFALKAIKEYKKFIYLGAVSDPGSSRVSLPKLCVQAGHGVNYPASSGASNFLKFQFFFIILPFSNSFIQMSLDLGLKYRLSGKKVSTCWAVR